MAIAMIGAETNGFALRNMVESTRYSALRAASVFSYRLNLALRHGGRYESFRRDPLDARGRASKADVRRLAKHLCVGNREKLFDCVYGGRMDNGPDEGYLFRGRGPSQVTGRYGYTVALRQIREQPGGERCPDLLADPDALLHPEWGVRSFFADWREKGLSKTAATGSLLRVRKHLNLGNPDSRATPNGMRNAKHWHAKAVKLLPDDEVVFERAATTATPGSGDGFQVLKVGSCGKGVEALQERLSGLGYRVGAIDGKFGELTADAVVAFQRRNGIDMTGIVTKKLWQQMQDAEPIDLGDRELATAKDLREAGSETAKATHFGKRAVEAVTGVGAATAGVGAVVEKVSEGATFFETCVAIGDRIGALIMNPTAWLVLAIIGISYGLFWYVERRRVSDHRSGAHVGR